MLLTIFVQRVSQKVVPIVKPKVDLITNLKLNRAVLTVILTLRLYGYEIHRQLGITTQVLLQGRYILVPVFQQLCYSFQRTNRPEAKEQLVQGYLDQPGKTTIKVLLQRRQYLQLVGVGVFEGIEVDGDFHGLVLPFYQPVYLQVIRYCYQQLYT